MRLPIWIQNDQDITLLSNVDGTVRTTILTPREKWGLPLGLSELLVGLRVSDLTTNGGVTIKWQWSLDGRTWKTGTTIITEKTSANDYTGDFSAPAERTPFGRVVAEVRDTVASNQISATVTSWGLYRYI